MRPRPFFAAGMYLAAAVSTLEAILPATVAIVAATAAQKQKNNDNPPAVVATKHDFVPLSIGFTPSYAIWGGSVTEIFGFSCVWPQNLE